MYEIYKTGLKWYVFIALIFLSAFNNSNFLSNKETIRNKIEKLIF